MLVKYQPQYKRENDFYSYKEWHNAGYPLNEKEARALVRNSPKKYLGPNTTHRMLKITEEVVIIETEIKFKETK